MFSEKKKYPALKEQYGLHLGSKYSLIYERKRNNSGTIVINTDAARIINEFDGKTSIDQIVQKLSTKYDENDTNLKDEIISFISSTDYILLLEKPSKQNIMKSGNWNIQIPRHISVELTDHCNYLCKHCYNESSPQRNHFIDEKRLVGILNDLNVLGAELIEFTGGEPLSHPSFTSVLKYALDLFNVISIITNGSLIKKDILKLFSLYKDKLLLQISLYGNNKDYVNWFAGNKNAFELSKHAIELTSREGIFVTLV
jgi:sulfatase maturation enzyme AslB (radical SAM superfamily)